MQTITISRDTFRAAIEAGISKALVRDTADLPSDEDVAALRDLAETATLSLTGDYISDDPECRCPAAVIGAHEVCKWWDLSFAAGFDAHLARVAPNTICKLIIEDA